MVDLTVIEGGGERARRRAEKAAKGAERILDFLSGDVEVPVARPLAADLRTALIEHHLRDMCTAIRQVEDAESLGSAERTIIALARLFHLRRVALVALDHPPPKGAA